MTAAPETCEVCNRSGPAAKRCEFGHRSGLCSCWRGSPCNVPVLSVVPNSRLEADNRAAAFFAWGGEA